MGRGQINIDLVFGYLAFVIFIWYFSGYMGDLFTPFIDYARIESVEKKVLLNRNEIASFVNVDNIGSVCNITLSGKYGNYVEYLIKGFNLFKKDAGFTYPNQTSGSALIIRDYDSFTVLAGTNSTGFNASLRFTIPYTLVRVDGFDNSVFDYYNYTIDDYGNLVFDVNLHAGSDNKLVGYVFHTGINKPSFLVIEVFSPEYDKLFVGSTGIMGSCFAGSESDKLTYHSFFKRLGYGSDEFYGLISMRTWWFDE